MGEIRIDANRLALDVRLVHQHFKRNAVIQSAVIVKVVRDIATERPKLSEGWHSYAVSILSRHAISADPTDTQPARGPFSFLHRVPTGRRVLGRALIPPSHDDSGGALHTD